MPGSGRTVMVMTGTGAGLGLTEVEIPDQGRKDDAGLHHGEIGADTDARAGSEGQILVAVAHQAGREAVGIEPAGIFPQQFMAVQRPDRQEQNVIGMDRPAAQFVARHDMAGEKADRRVKPHGFFQHLVDEGHGGQIAGFRHPAFQLRPGFRARPILNRRAVGEQIKRPGNRQRRGFMPGHDEKLHVVDQVFRRHAPAGFGVFRRQHVIQ